MLERQRRGLRKAERPLVSQIGDMLMERMRQMITNFHEFDTDNSNTIDFDEFVKAMTALGVLNADAVVMLWDLCDADGSGEIEYDELIAALEPEEPLEDRTSLTFAGRAYSVPADGKGKKVRRRRMLSENATKQLHDAFEEVSMDHIKSIFEKWDSDGNGTLTRIEFGEAMTTKPPEGLGLAVNTTETNRLFNKLDLDGSGKISYVELKNYLWKRRKEEHKRLMDKHRADKEDATVGVRHTRKSFNK